MSSDLNVFFSKNVFCSRMKCKIEVIYSSYKYLLIHVLAEQRNYYVFFPSQIQPHQLVVSVDSAARALSPLPGTPSPGSSSNSTNSGSGSGITFPISIRIIPNDFAVSV